MDTTATVVEEPVPEPGALAVRGGPSIGGR